ncbi:MAG TPA: hypothetical protein VL049_19930, partial [Candidatus Dormibacteraeota bacterium]|nr:hypothetical protein [Candidatus Dormibacteraeota bacterium]
MNALKRCTLRDVLVVALLGAVAAPYTAAGDPIRPHHTEGATHGVLVLTNTADEPLAHGELIQWEEARGAIASRLLIRFKDGSLYDESLRFSQRPVLRLLSYKLAQRGPSFTETSEISFDRSGQYRARVQEVGKEEKTASGSMSIPDDVSNGMTSLLLKNLRTGASATTHLLAFTPEPQILELHLSPEGSDHFVVGSTVERTTRFLIQPTVPGIKGVVATVIGKQPPSFRMWLTPQPAPALWKFEGPLYADGPTWRITPGSP